MKDPNSQISNQDRTLVVGVSIAVGVVAGFLVFWVVFFATVSREDVAGPFILSMLLSLIVLVLVPFGYQFLGRIYAQQIDRAREETFGNSIEPLSKSDVVQLSTTSPLSIGPRHLWYFGIQFFNEQWATRNSKASEPSHKATETHRT